MRAIGARRWAVCERVKGRTRKEGDGRPSAAQHTALIQPNPNKTRRPHHQHRQHQQGRSAPLYWGTKPVSAPPSRASSASWCRSRASTPSSSTPRGSSPWACGSDSRPTSRSVIRAVIRSIGLRGGVRGRGCSRNLSLPRLVRRLMHHHHHNSSPSSLSSSSPSSSLSPPSSSSIIIVVMVTGQVPEGFHLLRRGRLGGEGKVRGPSSGGGWVGEEEGGRL